MADVIYTVRYGGNDYEIQAPEGLTPEELTSQIEAQTRIPSRFAPPYSEEQAQLLQAERAARAPVAPTAAPPPATPQRPPTDAEIFAYTPQGRMQQMLRNIPASAAGVVEGLITPIIHPIQTFNTMVDLGGGVLSKLGVMDYDEKTANAVGEFFADRYGSLENIERTVVEDPVGALADLSMVLTGGGTAAARAPGALGRIGRATRLTGDLVNPVNLGAQAIRGAAATPVGRAVTAPVRALRDLPLLPLTAVTGVSASDIRRAATANAKLGAAVERHLSGEAPVTEPLEAARKALGNIYNERRERYTTDIAPVTSDPTVLDMTKIDEAMGNLYGRGSYRGVDINPASEKVWQDIYAKINEFKALGDEGRTIEALDRLKQAIYNIGKGYEPGSVPRSVATEASRTVRGIINEQAPDYARVMSNYEDLSDVIDELQTALSLGNNTSVDTALRKLQSVTRNNANTNFGYRQSLMDLLGKYGGEEVPYMLAGQALSSPEPRGLTAQLAQRGASIGAPMTALLTMDPTYLLGAAPALASPQVVGRGARLTGQARGAVSDFLGAQGPALALGATEMGVVTENLRNAAMEELRSRYANQPAPAEAPNIFDGISDEDLQLIIENPAAFLPPEEEETEAEQPAEESSVAPTELRAP